MYRQDGERCDVEFIDDRLGIRKAIVDNDGNIINFPGIEKGEWTALIESENCLRPVIRFRTVFQNYDDKHYIMINQALTSGKMDKEEYDIWLEDTLKLFNVPIDEYI